MISEEEVRHIAKLARLGLTEEEIKKFQKELSAILDYVEKLKEVNIAEVFPARHAILVENVKREDGIKRKTEGTKLLGLSPETEKGFLKVKSIF